MSLLYNFYICQGPPSCEEDDPTEVTSPVTGNTWRCSDDRLCHNSWFKNACKRKCGLCVSGNLNMHSRITHTLIYFNESISGYSIVLFLFT